MGASMASSTVTAYARDWKVWLAYAEAHGLDPMPAEPSHVCAFLAAYSAERKATTTQRAAMAIGKAHRLAGFPSPVDHEHVRRTLAGLRRTKGTAPRQALPLCTDDIARLVVAVPDGLRGKRDRALVLVGFVGAFRVGELVALDVEDLDPRPEGLVVRVRRAKTDQEGRGRLKPLPLAPERVDLCPVRALRAWQEAAGIDSGPLWRGVTKEDRLRSGRLTSRAALDLIKALAVRAGLNSERISPHSLRAGHVTEAKRRDAPDLAVMSQTHHARAESLLGYVREADPFRHTSAKFLGL
jgi:integrase